MYKEIKRIKPYVEEILEHSQSARNSDKELILLVWEKHGLVLDEKQREIYKKLPSSESIRRTRQKLQEQGKYKADQKIIDAREENRRNMEVENIRARLPKEECFGCHELVAYGETYCDSCRI